MRNYCSKKYFVLVLIALAVTLPVACNSDEVEIRGRVELFEDLSEAFVSQIGPSLYSIQAREFYIVLNTYVEILEGFRELIHDEPFSEQQYDVIARNVARAYGFQPDIFTDLIFDQTEDLNVNELNQEFDLNLNPVIAGAYINGQMVSDSYLREYFFMSKDNALRVIDAQIEETRNLLEVFGAYIEG